MTLKCEICDGIAIGVASSPYAAVSHAYCRRCLDENAEPSAVLDYLMDDVADGDVNKLHGGIRYIKTFVDGEYVSWDTYFENRRVTK